MQRIIYLVIALFCNIGLIAQFQLEGIVFDQDQKPLPGTTIVLLENQDSSMVAFGISDMKGRFELEDISKGNYILQLSYVSFKTQYHSILVDGDEKKFTLGLFTLEASEEILQEVEVKAEHIPMGILGDTINYNAAAFNTRPGATVEDLLKKLPGVQVDRDGSIRAMGEDVENVLVDGKEFFGEDPKIATRNLEAEAIDKVQLYDKKSEIAEFTGIDDGDEEKTINLKLKEEYKTGGFGNVTLEGGTDERYQGKINYNRFSSRMQAAAILNANNINQQAFTFNEFISFMGGLGNAVSGNNGLFNFGEFGRSAIPQGITQAASSGLNFNYDFSNKLKLYSYYFYLRDDLFLDRLDRSDQFTDAVNFATIDSSTTNRLNQNHRVNLKLDYKPNPLTQVIWRNTGSGLLNTVAANSSTQFFTNDLFSGKTSSNLASDNQQLGLEGNVQFRKKFSKPGRNWLSQARYQWGEYEEEQDLSNLFLLDGNESLLMQIQEYNHTNHGIGAETAYTEPIAKGLYLSGRYQFEQEIEEPKKYFYDLNNGQRDFNEALSREFSKTNYIHEAGLFLKKNTKRTKLNIGLDVQNSTVIGKLNTEQEPVENQNTYLLPNLSLEHDLNQQNSIKFNYTTQVNLPTLSQLAPLPENSNPNFLLLGNPNLNPEYRHNFRLSYSLIDQFNSVNFFALINTRLTQNWINNRIDIDNQFLKTIIPENIDHQLSYRGNIDFSAPIRPLKLNIRSGAYYNLSSYVGNINDQSGEIKEGNWNLNLSLDNRKKDHLDIAAGIDLNLSTRKYAVNSAFDQQFRNTKFFIDGEWYISEQWTLSSAFDFISYSSEFFSEGSQYMLWNAGLMRTFNENKWALELKVYDILNQNIGLLRSGDLNGLIENRFNTLTQYAMMSVRYRIGKKKEKEGMFFE